MFEIAPGSSPETHKAGCAECHTGGVPAYKPGKNHPQTLDAAK